MNIKLFKISSVDLPHHPAYVVNDLRHTQVICDLIGTKDTVWSQQQINMLGNMTSTEWYGNDWSAGELIPVGPNPFTEDTVFYLATKAFAEGLPDRVKIYTGNCSKFILCLDSWEDLTRVCKIIVGHVRSKHTTANQ